MRRTVRFCVTPTMALMASATLALYALPAPAQQPENLGATINSTGDDYYPQASPDGRVIYFTSSRSGGLGGEDLYAIERGEAGWSAPVRLPPPINSPQNDGAASFSGDGQAMIFAICGRADGQGSCDLYSSELTGMHWSDPVNLGAVVNSPSWESSPALSADGTTLVFASKRPGGQGQEDLWITRRGTAGAWSRPENLGPTVNSPGTDAYPYLAPDGRTLYFSSDGHGGLGKLDLFRTALGGAAVVATESEAGERSDTWTGTWTHPGYEYAAEMLLHTSAAQAVEGNIAWTLRKSPKPNEKRIGRVGVEYVTGRYDPSTRTFLLDGIRKDDPDGVIGLDSYRLVLSPDGSLAGTSKAGGGWDSRFSLSPTATREVMPNPSRAAPRAQAAAMPVHPMERQFRFVSNNYTGNWTADLLLTREGTGWRGKIRFDQHGTWEALTNVVLTERALAFDRPGASQVYRGVVSGGRVDGTFTWQGSTFPWSAEETGAAVPAPVATASSGPQWGAPVNLGPPINSSKADAFFTVGGAGDIAYFASNRPGGLGGLDLYSVPLPDSLRPEPTVIVRGSVTDPRTGTPIAAQVVVEDLLTSTTVATRQSNSATGSYLVVLPAGRSYGVSAQKDGYFFHSSRFDVPPGTAYREVTQDVALVPIAAGARVTLNNIFFESGKASLLPESRRELERAATLFKANPSLVVEVGGHTDNVGGLEVNQSLSLARARVVRDALVSGGVAPGQLQAKGYGYARPVADNATAEGRQANRRTELVVLSN